MNLRNLFSATALTLGLLAALPANAQVFSFNTNEGATGDLKSTSSVIDLGKDYLKFTATVKPGASTDGFWVALSPGPNPKGHAGELALVYFDASAGAPVLTTYAYNGENGGSSWQDGNGKVGGNQAPDKILSSLTNNSWVKSTTVQTNLDGTKTLGFEINTTAIQNHNPKNPGNTAWTGLDYGAGYGVWLHSFDVQSRSYGTDGFFTSLHVNETGYIDLDQKHTQPVPEPGTMIALGAGALALLKRRKKA